MLVGIHRRHREGLGIAIGIAAAAVAIAQPRAEDWPEWRGKGRLGVWNETGLVDRLPASLPIAWRTPLNKGYSGPAVANGRVFVTDARRAVRDQVIERILVDRKSTRLNSSHIQKSRMPSSA